MVVLIIEGGNPEYVHRIKNAIPTAGDGIYPFVIDLYSSMYSILKPTKYYDNTRYSGDTYSISHKIENKEYEEQCNMLYKLAFEIGLKYKIKDKINQTIGSNFSFADLNTAAFKMCTTVLSGVQRKDEFEYLKESMEAVKNFDKTMFEDLTFFYITPAKNEEEKKSIEEKRKNENKLCKEDLEKLGKVVEFDYNSAITNIKKFIKGKLDKNELI